MARHEAAHFVAAWAVECPNPQVETARPRGPILAVTSGQVGRPTPFEHILITLSGPVADHWREDNARMLESERDIINGVVADCMNGIPLDPDDGDWDGILRQMAEYGIDISDRKALNDALSMFIDAVRAILNLCDVPWREATEYLVEHERIGFYGPNNPRPSYIPPLPAAFKDKPQPDNGEEAETFFCRWGGDYGEPPEEVRSCVEKFRAMAQEKISNVALCHRC